MAATDPKPQAALPKGKLAALTSSALALHGVAGAAHADSPTDEWTADYRYSYYKEDNLPVNLWSGDGSRERYKIHSNQFQVVAPISTRNDVSVDLIYETMAGASPWYVTPGIDGNYVQAMSGATISEQRLDVNANLTQYFDRSTLSVNGGISNENDYFSGNFGFGGTRSYFDKNLTLALGFGFSWDTIEPTDPEFHGHTEQTVYHKETVAMNFSVSQLFKWKAMGQFSLAWKNGKGYLSDPYKRVLVQGVQENDARPELRDQIAVTGRYVQFVTPANASLHFDIAYHWDDWGTDALSAELTWYQQLGEMWTLVPHARYYSQSQVFFYGPVFAGGTDTPYATSDYRLSPFGAISYGLRGEAHFERWPFDFMDLVFALGYERYMTSASWGLKSVTNPSPGLVDYHLFAGRIGARF